MIPAPASACSDFALADALTGVQAIVDVTNSSSPDEQPATDFFVAPPATCNGPARDRALVTA